jgi:hypothetical protein
MTLPSICRFGQTGLERKLLLYYDAKKRLTFEFRARDSTGYDPTLMCPLVGEFEFVPLYEIGARVFLFEYRQDRDAAQAHYESQAAQPRKRKPRDKSRRKNRTRRPRNKSK